MPALVDYLKENEIDIPVIAAGGIYNGPGLAAALALGAEGVSMGTRFMLTKECVLHENFKQLCLAATEQDTFYDTVFDGMWSRVLKSKGAEDVQKNRFGLLERFQAAMKIRKVLNMSYPTFFSMGFKTMLAGEDGASLWTQARQAVGKEVYYSQFSYSLIFGLLVTTILTLFFIPIIYSIIEGKKDDKELALEGSEL